METISATEAAKSFGEMLIKVQQQESICINKNGNPVAFVLSATELPEYQQFKQQQLHKKIDEGLQAIKEGRVIDGQEVMERLRKKFFSVDS
jgi:prevent-host-death family protein